MTVGQFCTNSFNTKFSGVLRTSKNLLNERITEYNCLTSTLI